MRALGSVLLVFGCGLIGYAAWAFLSEDPQGGRDFIGVVALVVAVFAAVLGAIFFRAGSKENR